MNQSQVSRTLKMYRLVLYANNIAMVIVSGNQKSARNLKKSLLFHRKMLSIGHSMEWQLNFVNIKNINIKIENGYPQRTAVFLLQQPNFQANNATRAHFFLGIILRHIVWTGNFIFQIPQARLVKSRI